MAKTAIKHPASKALWLFSKMPSLLIPLGISGLVAWAVAKNEGMGRRDTAVTGVSAMIGATAGTLILNRMVPKVPTSSIAGVIVYTLASCVASYAASELLLRGADTVWG